MTNYTTQITDGNTFRLSGFWWYFSFDNGSSVSQVSADFADDNRKRTCKKWWNISHTFDLSSKGWCEGQPHHRHRKTTIWETWVFACKKTPRPKFGTNTGPPITLHFVVGFPYQSRTNLQTGGAAVGLTDRQSRTNNGKTADRQAWHGRHGALPRKEGQRHGYSDTWHKEITQPHRQTCCYLQCKYANRHTGTL